MRFHSDGPSIPDVLLERRDNGRVVFLCGAGVSQPAGMPSFVGLTKYVIEFFAPPDESEIMRAFRPWLEDDSAANVPLDQIFNLLHQEYGKEEVNALVTKRLGAIPIEAEVGREHDLIRRISSNQSHVPQIVTTNFDRLFEVGSHGKEVVPYVPPVFPDLNFGSAITGVTYLHGRLVDESSEHHPYVLSSADFGRAYLSEGWATNFMRSLLQRYTVVLVGYQAQDPPVKYLLQGLNHDGQYDSSRLYAFDRGLPEEVEAKWRDRGVTAIAYPDHLALWKTMESWANRADDPRAWRASIIAKSQQNPKELAPHERGQVAHVLRSTPGSRLFAEANPAPHAEWICVMDAHVRSAKESNMRGDNEESFDPKAAYGLDDDLTSISEDDRKQGVGNDNLLVWRDGDDSPPDLYRLAGRPAEGFEATPIRLGNLITWISKSINSPVLAWWTIRQNGLHPRLLQQIEWQLERMDDLSGRARHVWNLILEHHRDPRNRRWNGDWFDLKRRVKVEGWTSSTLRELRRITTPQLHIGLPFGRRQSRPPSSSWDEIRLADLGHFELKLLDRHNERLEVPDAMLAQVFRILESQLALASGLLGDIETVYFRTPSCYPKREAIGKERASDAAEVMTWFVELFDRMVSLRPMLAHAHASTWLASDPYFFRKLKLYAFSKRPAFRADYVAEELLSFDQDTFWDADVARELLFLLVDRWSEFPEEKRDELTDRILSGPDQPSHWSDDQFPALRDQFAARYARYIELQGCDLGVDRSRRLAEMIRGVGNWNDGWAISTVTDRGSQVGFVGTDETPDAIMTLPVNEIVSRAKADLERDFGSFTEKRPFTGLVKANPRRALAALAAAGRAGDYPQAFWAALIEEMPQDISPRLRRTFLHRLARLPYEVVAELRYTLGRWLEQKLVEIIDLDSDLGWEVFDHIVEGLLSGGVDGAEIGAGKVIRNGMNIEQSKRTYGHAINGPIGMCAEALLKAIPGESQEAGSLIPGHIKSRIERLFDAREVDSDHAVSIVTRQLNWVMHVDPIWTQERLVPMLAFDHKFSEPAWNGFLQGGRVPSPSLTKIIKPLLLKLLPWIERLSWDRDLTEVAAQWLGFMRIFHPDEPAGLTRAEMRSNLRQMSDQTRNRFIFWLGLVGQKNENGWTELVIPFINNDWPRERLYRTSASMKAWVGLLDDTGEFFPLVYDAVKKFLVAVENNDHPFYRFTRDVNDEEPITVRFPETTLDLIYRTTPQALTRPPYELPRILALIAEADARLTSDHRYLRLIAMIEES